MKNTAAGVKNALDDARKAQAAAEKAIQKARDDIGMTENRLAQVPVGQDDSTMWVGKEVNYQIEVPLSYPCVCVGLHHELLVQKHSKHSKDASDVNCTYKIYLINLCNDEPITCR